RRPEPLTRRQRRTTGLYRAAQPGVGGAERQLERIAVAGETASIPSLRLLVVEPSAQKPRENPPAALGNGARERAERVIDLGTKALPAAAALHRLRNVSQHPTPVLSTLEANLDVQPRSGRHDDVRRLRPS